MLIHNFYLKQHHVCTVRFPSVRALNKSQSDFFRFSCRLEFRTATFFACFIIAYGFQLSCFELYIFESIQEMIFPFTFSQRFSVQEKFYFVSTGNHIYRFYYIFFVVPMSDDVNARLLYIYPTVPHHLMGIKCILWNTHGICHSAATIVFFTPEVGICIREDNFHST